MEELVDQGNLLEACSLLQQLAFLPLLLLLLLQTPTLLLLRLLVLVLVLLVLPPLVL